MAATQRAPANGVLPVTAIQTSGNSPKPASKATVTRLKVVIRRLPPALTEAEFASIIGDEWKLAQGKVDWFLYKPGKDSKDASKPSRPSRAYFHLTSDAHLMSLSETIRLSVFEDAQNTFTSSCLIGPPTVEFAPYGRTPGGRRRVDARAGTIDQDAEFMAFLEGLANPPTGKDVGVDGLVEGAPATKEKVTTTPLVQYLKDKKASKSRDAAVKAAKKQEGNLAKGKSAKDSPEKKGKDGKGVVERAAKEAVKILNREATAKVGSSAKSDSSDGPPKLDLRKVPGRQRGAVISAHIRMLERDLGFSPAQAHRQVRRDTADAQKAERATAAEKAPSEVKDSVPSQSAQPPIPVAPKGNIQVNSRRSRAKASSSGESEAKASTPSTPATPTAPMVLLKKPETAQTTPTAPAPKPAPIATPRKPQNVAVPSAGATQAFIKHANPSQGVTEPLLKEAMEQFGAVSMVEIDKRKGFAYVEFIESDGLKKAMAANPIPVAQGTVQVMQRKGTSLAPEKKPAHVAPQSPRGGRGGGRGGTIGRRGRGGARGGGNAAPSTAPTGPAAKG
ncbi:Regulator of nonsense transcripts [Lachnellula subtilissima]|uniref:Regulator of nonsense transcripts n=1 Tax=Lachnellula subtilissima TaxID=602034 RepID=A0A8H8UG03_9HELO|nr:Regulator of nonsense transcripts [Lachnellula subtilissima]